jgi:hypothetical protein
MQNEKIYVIILLHYFIRNQIQYILKVIPNINSIHNIYSLFFLEND